MTTSGAACCWRSLHKMSVGSLVEFVMLLKLLFLYGPDRFHLCTYNYFMNEFMRLCLILLISIIIYYFTSVSITTSFWIFTLAIFFFHNWCLTFFRVYCKCWSCIYLSLDFPSIPKEFDTCLWLGNFCSNLQSLCLLFQILPFLHKLCFSYQFHHLGFHPSALSSLEDLWLYFFDCLLFDLDEYLLIDLTDGGLRPIDTSESLELTAAFLSSLLQHPSSNYGSVWMHTGCALHH